MVRFTSLILASIAMRANATEDAKVKPLEDKAKAIDAMEGEAKTAAWKQYLSDLTPSGHEKGDIKECQAAHSALVSALKDDDANKNEVVPARVNALQSDVKAAVLAFAAKCNALDEAKPASGDVAEVKGLTKEQKDFYASLAGQGSTCCYWTLIISLVLVTLAAGVVVVMCCCCADNEAASSV